MKYISLLRGINVGGQKKIKMNELKNLYEAQGFQNVTSYIQSGNLVFDVKSRSINSIKQKIENAIQTHYGFEVPVDIRTPATYQQIIDACPFEESRQAENSNRILVSFLSATVSKDSLALLAKVASPSEKLSLYNDVFFIYCPDGYGRSKLSNNFVEKTLGLTATTRNWKTVNQLLTMSQI